VNDLRVQHREDAAAAKTGRVGHPLAHALHIIGLRTQVLAAQARHEIQVLARRLRGGRSRDRECGNETDQRLHRPSPFAADTTAATSQE
jgi:ribose 1,5-bisphosphokinase PhnN